MTKMGKRITRFSIYCTLLLVPILVITACASEEEPVDSVEILARIHVGDRRQHALQALSDAWHHSECKLLDGAVEDIFLYGPKKRDSVTIIGVLSEPQGEQLIVKQTGTYESYFLDAPDFGQYCEPPVHNAFE